MRKRLSWAVKALLVMAVVGGLQAAASAVPVYTQADLGGDVVMVEATIGAAPENSDSPYRWYWSYDDRFQIDFEAVSGSADVADGSEWAAIQDALDIWEDVPGASVTNSLYGFDGDWGGLNGDNELAWVEGGWNSSFGFSTTWIAVARTWYYSTTLIQAETDIFFNGQNFSWYTDSDDSGESQYVEHIALHELGHAFSLGDLYESVDSSRTMYGYSSSRSEDITLDEGDIAALAFAYPVTAVPLPGGLCLAALGAGLAAVSRRVRSRRSAA